MLDSPGAGRAGCGIGMGKPKGTFESQSHGRKVEMGTDRSFGLVFAAVFAVVALAPLASGGAVRAWAGMAALAFAVAALGRPGWLRPLNRVWFQVGLALHRVVTPVVMGLLFFLTLTPLSLLMRATGKDPLSLRRDPGRTSYWVLRQPPGPAPESMRRQF